MHKIRTERKLIRIGVKELGKRLRVLLLFGGRSGEHEVSLQSAASVFHALDKNKYDVVPVGITKEGRWLAGLTPDEVLERGFGASSCPVVLQPEPTRSGLLLLDEKKAALCQGLEEPIQVVFPVLHGTFGEDGCVQGLLELAGLPYVGSGVLGSALAMDKIFAKTIFGHAGLPQGPYVAVMLEELLHHQDEVVNKIEEEILYPVFVKPSNMGSSVGISKVYDRDELIKALKLASTYDRRIIVEQGIECREIEVAILGNDYPEASAVGEIIPAAEFYDYRSKYCDEGRTKLCIPADIPPKIAEEVRDIAIKAYTLLDCCGFARVDFFLEKETEKIYINEINTIPGFTRFSMFPLLWQHSGLAYPDLIERIVMLGYERYNVKNRR